jgi:hypothetical protein
MDIRSSGVEYPTPRSKDKINTEIFNFPVRKNHTPKGRIVNSVEVTNTVNIAWGGSDFLVHMMHKSLKSVTLFLNLVND